MQTTPAVRRPANTRHCPHLASQQRRGPRKPPSRPKPVHMRPVTQQNSSPPKYLTARGHIREGRGPLQLTHGLGYRKTPDPSLQLLHAVSEEGWAPSPRKETLNRQHTEGDKVPRRVAFPKESLAGVLEGNRKREAQLRQRRHLPPKQSRASSGATTTPTNCTYTLKNLNSAHVERSRDRVQEAACNFPRRTDF